MSGRFSWLRRLLGSPAAQLARAETLALEEAHDDAFPLFVAAARAGLARAQNRLGRCYLLGQGVPPSPAEAVGWLTRAAEAGDVTAQTQLAALSMQGLNDQGGGLFD